MSRRAASITQADVARALRAAQSAGRGWQVAIEPGGVIRLIQVDAPEPPKSPKVDGKKDWRL